MSNVEYCIFIPFFLSCDFTFPYSSGSTINFVSLIESCLIRLISRGFLFCFAFGKNSIFDIVFLVFYSGRLFDFAFANIAEGNPLWLNSINPSSAKEINTKRIKQIFKRYTEKKEKDFLLFSFFASIRYLTIINRIRIPLPANTTHKYNISSI